MHQAINYLFIKREIAVALVMTREWGFPDAKQQPEINGFWEEKLSCCDEFIHVVILVQNYYIRLEQQHFFQGIIISYDIINDVF